jgi:hypothetical protein
VLALLEEELDLLRLRLEPLALLPDLPFLSAVAFLGCFLSLLSCLVPPKELTQGFGVELIQLNKDAQTRPLAMLLVCQPAHPTLTVWPAVWQPQYHMTSYDNVGMRG